MAYFEVLYRYFPEGTGRTRQSNIQSMAEIRNRESRMRSVTNPAATFGNTALNMYNIETV
jgi:hypothetical protein